MRLEAELDEARRKMQADERELVASRYTHTSHLLDTTVDETRFQVSNRELVKRAYGLEIKRPIWNSFGRTVLG